MTDKRCGTCNYYTPLPTDPVRQDGTGLCTMIHITNRNGDADHAPFWYDPTDSPTAMYRKHVVEETNGTQCKAYSGKPA